MKPAEALAEFLCSRQPLWNQWRALRQSLSFEDCPQDADPCWLQKVWHVGSEECMFDKFAEVNRHWHGAQSCPSPCGDTVGELRFPLHFIQMEAILFEEHLAWP